MITGTGAHTITFASTGLTSVTSGTITVGAAASCGSGPGATITSVSRAAGTTLGGTALTITGTGFQATDCVRFGATAASLVFVNATTLNVTTPAGLPGAVNVSVQQGSTTSTLTNGFEYIAAATQTIVSHSFETGLAPFVTATGATVTNTRARTGSQSVMHTFTASAGQNAANYDHSGDPALLPGGVYIHWFLYIPAATKTALTTGQIKLHFQRYNGGGGWMELGMGPEITGSQGTIRLIGDPVSGNPPAGGSYTYPVDAWVEVMVWYRRDTAAHTGTSRWWIGSGGSLQFMGSLTHAQLGFDSPTSGVRSSFSIYTQNAASYPFSVFTDDVTIANGWVEP